MDSRLIYISAEIVYLKRRRESKQNAWLQQHTNTNSSEEVSSSRDGPARMQCLWIAPGVEHHHGRVQSAECRAQKRYRTRPIEFVEVSNRIGSYGAMSPLNSIKPWGLHKSAGLSLVGCLEREEQIRNQRWEIRMVDGI